jgi:Phosphomethylpyrimidine kinase
MCQCLPFPLAAHIELPSSVASPLSLSLSSVTLPSTSPSTLSTRTLTTHASLQVHRVPQLVKSPVDYTRAGSDSGGGADVQADLHAILTLGGHACIVVTCLTAQNSVGVNRVESVSVDMIVSQWESLCSDMQLGAVTIGMVGSHKAAETIADTLNSTAATQSTLPSASTTHSLQSTDTADDQAWMVLHPVMISTCG